MNLKELLEKVGLDAAQIFELVPSAVFTIDKQKQITSWNKRAAEITGYSHEEAIGKTCSILGVESCQSNCILLSQEILKPRRNIECEIKTKDGKSKIVSKSSDVLKDEKGNIIGGVESFEDISERKKAEQIMQKRADILNYIDHPIYVVGKNLEYLFANNKLLSRLNLSSLDEIIGKKYGQFHTAAQTAEFADKIDEVFKTGKTLRYEYKTQRDDKGKYLRTLSPNSDAQGNVVSVTISSDELSTVLLNNMEKLITICAYCKKIKDEAGQWLALEAYFENKIDSTFSHGMCPACSEDAHKELKLLREIPGKVGKALY